MGRKLSLAAALALATACFAAALALRAQLNPWWSSAAAAAVAIAASSVALRDRLRPLCAVRASAVAGAVALGVAMVAATHAAYRALIAVVPDLEREVSALYRDVGPDAPGPALTVALIAVIVTAEELVWRGVAVELVHDRLSAARTVAVTVALYAVPQLAGGEWVLIAAAVGAGAVFAAQRVVTRGLVAPLVTHAIWSASIFSALPLTG